MLVVLVAGILGIIAIGTLISVVGDNFMIYLIIGIVFALGLQACNIDR